jgi:hypothetical protein
LQTVAATLPRPASRFGETATQLLDAVVKLAPWAVPFIGGGAWRWWQKRQARKAHERELLEAMAEQCRASADFDRFQIRFLIGREVEARIPHSARQQWEAVRTRTREARIRLWRARGYPESSDGERTEAELAILQEFRQTRRWKMSDQLERAKPLPQRAEQQRDE